MAIAPLVHTLLPEKEFAEFRAELEELAVGAAEETSPLRQNSAISHDLEQSFSLGSSEQTGRLLHMLTSLRTE